ncbi:hypothetical protein DXG03_000872 [Asterophora parasitica]|uniref:Uncharacterized protein n=1 Tax=Asterophora parasitica TaxID=117018 RepID=A0A9P7KBW2_9AGAR|nr:hypothetical protein DXG03_000872 [Asterophora parasitica]
MPKPQEKRASNVLPRDKDLPNKPRPNSPSYRPEPRSAPLPPQDDLFLRRKLAEDEKYEDSRRMSLAYSDRDDFNDLDRGPPVRDGKRAAENSSRGGGGNSSRPYDHISYLGVRRPTGANRPANHYAQKARVTSEKRKRVDDSEQFAGDRTRSSSHLGDRPRPSNDDSLDAPLKKPLILPKSASFAPATGNGTVLLTGSAPVEERVQRVVALFRDLSRLSSDVAQDAEHLARDDKKLKAYTELSSVLSKVSSTAAAAVMPTLADILLRHAQGKQRAEKNLNAIAGVWNQAVDLFVSEVSHAIDTKLGSAVKKIREEAELVHASIVLQNSTPKLGLTNTNDTFSSELAATNRFRDDNRAHRDESRAHLTPDGQATEADADRDSKRRRRFSSPSHGTREVNAPQSATLDGKLGASMQEILSQMKTKIDEQAQSLQNLMKENNELKAALDHRPSITSWTSFPFPTTAAVAARQVPSQVNPVN